MFKYFVDLGHTVRFRLILALMACLFVSKVSSASAPEVVKSPLWDPNKYISVDEIKPGMKAYLLTSYEGVKIEKFEMEVVSVAKDMGLGGAFPSKSAIFAKGIDERLVHTGLVRGCSGSPVYIDGRLAGAASFGWTWSKDCIWGITPIEEILLVGKSEKNNSTNRPGGYGIDFSKGLDLAQVYKVITTPKLSHQNDSASMAKLPIVLAISGGSGEEFSQLDDVFKSYGFFTTSGIASTGELEDIEFEPGGVLAVPLVSGDITMAASGSVTDIIGDKIYGFGHSFTSEGLIELPIAPGKTHLVLASRASSFKIIQPGAIKGTLKADEETGVYGVIGLGPRMIPLRIKINRHNDLQSRVYNCQLAIHRRFTPLIMARTIAAAAFVRGGFGFDHMVEYKIKIDLDGFDSIAFENVSTGEELFGFLNDCTSSVGLMMNNPFEEVDITNIEVEVDIKQKNILSRIWSAKLSDSKIKAGDIVKVEVVVESYLADKKKYQFEVKIPDGLKPGDYELILTGASGYENFLRKTIPHKFMVENVPSMIEAINKITQLPNDRLYCILVLPRSGISLNRAELVDLPASKAIVFADSKRTVRPVLLQKWIEESLNPQTIVIDEKVLRIKVEKD